MKIKVPVRVAVLNQIDTWAERKAQLADLSAEQTRADCALVEAQRAAAQATANLNAAIAARTTAEKKLTAARANLGSD